MRYRPVYNSKEQCCAQESVSVLYNSEVKWTLVYLEASYIYTSTLQYHLVVNFALLDFLWFSIRRCVGSIQSKLLMA